MLGAPDAVLAEPATPLSQAAKEAGLASAVVSYLERVEAMGEAAESLVDATWELHSREYIDGLLAPEQRVAVKFRRPLDL